VRIVCDTNVIISASMLPDSIPAQTLNKAEMQGALLYSDDTLAELIRVLERPKLRPYLHAQTVAEFYARVRINWEHVPIIQQVRACRDAKDDMFLELAVNGAAHVLITGDRDLLALHPYGNVQIVTPAAFLSDRYSRSDLELDSPRK
jgi:putative PIN family toxin of toxin-antitoxin system